MGHFQANYNDPFCYFLGATEYSFEEIRAAKIKKKQEEKHLEEKKQEMEAMAQTLIDQKNELFKQQEEFRKMVEQQRQEMERKQQESIKMQQQQFKQMQEEELQKIRAEKAELERVQRESLIKQQEEFKLFQQEEFRKMQDQLKEQQQMEVGGGNEAIPSLTTVATTKPAFTIYEDNSNDGLLPSRTLSSVATSNADVTDERKSSLLLDDTTALLQSNPMVGCRLVILLIACMSHIDYLNDFFSFLGFRALLAILTLAAAWPRLPPAPTTAPLEELGGSSHLPQ